MNKPDITLVIPMYNENSIIKDTANTLHEYMSTHFDSYEILFSDDGSKDGCADTVRNMQLSNVRVIGYSENRGKGCAIRTAILEAGGEVIMFTDADLAYGTEVISKLYAELSGNKDASMIIGSRNLSKDGYEGYTFLRKIMSKVYIKMLGMMGGFKFSDSQCGCKAYKNDAAKDIFSRCKVDGFAFDFESIIWAQKLKYNIIETPVKIINHHKSTVKILKDSFKMLRDVMGIRRRINREIKS